MIPFIYPKKKGECLACKYVYMFLTFAKNRYTQRSCPVCKKVTKHKIYMNPRVSKPWRRNHEM